MPSESSNALSRPSCIGFVTMKTWKQTPDSRFTKNLASWDIQTCIECLSARNCICLTYTMSCHQILGGGRCVAFHGSLDLCTTSIRANIQHKLHR